MIGRKPIFALQSINNMGTMNNKIVIENPPKKILDFIMRVQKEKEESRKRLLEKENHTFSIQI